MFFPLKPSSSLSPRLASDVFYYDPKMRFYTDPDEEQSRAPTWNVFDRVVYQSYVSSAMFKASQRANIDKLIPELDLDEIYNRRRKKNFSLIIITLGCGGV